MYKVLKKLLSMWSYERLKVVAEVVQVDLLNVWVHGA